MSWRGGIKIMTCMWYFADSICGPHVHKDTSRIKPTTRLCSLGHELWWQHQGAASAHPCQLKPRFNFYAPNAPMASWRKPLFLSYASIKWLSSSILLSFPFSSISLLLFLLEKPALLQDPLTSARHLSNHHSGVRAYMALQVITLGRHIGHALILEQPTGKPTTPTGDSNQSLQSS